MKMMLVFFFLFISCGCAPLLTGTVTDLSTLVTLGGFGQTVVRLTETGPRQPPVGALPAQYASDTERMIREAWEQNFQVTKTVHWQGEGLPWQELAANAARRADGTRAVFALVAKRALHAEPRYEELTVYRTVSGRLIADPSDSYGEAYYAETREIARKVPVFRYTAYFFTKSAQPSGILASPDTRDEPCKSVSRSGILVRAVGKSTPAHIARIQSGDVIISVNGRPAAYPDFFSLLTPGQNTVTLCRNGQPMTTALPMPSPRGVDERRR